MNQIIKHNPSAIIRIGLAAVFLANSLTAFFQPNEFIELIDSSFLSGLLPIATKDFVLLIGFNDALVSLFLLFNVKWVSLWAMLWLIGVMAVRGLSLDTLEESGFLLMAIALYSHRQLDS